MRGGAAWPAAAQVAVALLATACSTGRARAPETPRPGWQQRGIASWYGPGFHGKRTANGEVYDMDGISAAHKTLPFGSVVEVENLDNGRRLKVRINDRGPFIRGRVIDLSRGAARELGLIGPGTAKVRLRLVGTAPTVVARGADAERGWVVQAGAFREARHARELAERLSRRYPGVRGVSGDGWHRVRVGPFGRRSRAEEVARELSRAGTPAYARPA